MVLNRCIDRIDLPKGIILIGLKHMIICGGNWNEERIRYLLIWLASCVPYLKSFTVKNQTRENAILFMDGLSQNSLFIEQFKDSLSLESILFVLMISIIDSYKIG